MNFSYEVLLVLGIIGFYLYDSALLLYRHDFVLIKGYRDWRFQLPNQRWSLGRKLLLVLHPCLPAALYFKTNWLRKPDKQPERLPSDRLASFLYAIRPLRALVIVLWLEMLLVFPLVLFTLGTGYAFYGIVLAIYLTITCMVLLTVQRRAALCLTGRQVWSVAFDAVACPPFALNLPRKLSLQYALAATLLPFASHYFKEAELARWSTELQQLIADEMQMEDEDSQYMAELSLLHGQLMELAK